MVFFVRKLEEDAFIPSKGSEYAAGYDLYAREDFEIKSHGKVLVKTGIAIEMTKGIYGRIAPRSGMAWKHHIDVGAGVIDCDYRGDIGVVLFNHSDEDLTFERGTRVAQIIFTPYYEVNLEEKAELSESVRGSGGYGSSGGDSKSS